MDDKQIWQYEARFWGQVPWLAMLRQCCCYFPYVGPEQASTKHLLQQNTYSDTRVLCGRANHPRSLPPSPFNSFKVRQQKVAASIGSSGGRVFCSVSPLPPCISTSLFQTLKAADDEYPVRWCGCNSLVIWVSLYIIFLYLSFDSCFHMKKEELNLLTQAEEIDKHWKNNLSCGPSLHTFQLLTANKETKCHSIAHYLGGRKDRSFIKDCVLLGRIWCEKSQAHCHSISLNIPSTSEGCGNG